MRTFIDYFVGFWIAASILSLGWYGVRLLWMYRGASAESSYLEVPVSSILLYAALLAVALSALALMIRRSWRLV